MSPWKVILNMFLKSKIIKKEADKFEIIKF